MWDKDGHPAMIETSRVTIGCGINVRLYSRTEEPMIVQTYDENQVVVMDSDHSTLHHLFFNRASCPDVPRSRS